MAIDPSLPALQALLTQGHTRILDAWALEGPAQTGLWWRASTTAVATPAFVTLTTKLSANESLAALLATEERYRHAWLSLQAARLVELGRRNEVAGLCQAINRLGMTAPSLQVALANARLTASPYTDLERALLGVPADQPAATPALLRVLGETAPLVEGGLGRPVSSLPTIHPLDPSKNWVAGRLLQAPGMENSGEFVLSGQVLPCGENRMYWVLGTPWAMLLAMLVFTAEAWAAERGGGVQLELPLSHITSFAAPPRIDIIVTLQDGREVLCGSLGELCLRVVDALGMALLPALDVGRLDVALAPVIAELLRAGVWSWRADARPRYLIGDDFGYDCYRREGHQYIGQAGDTLYQTLRSICVAWARERAGE